MNDLKQATLGFIGGGNMAHSLIAGLLSSGYTKDHIWVADPNADKRERLTQMGIRATHNDAEVAERADIIILAIKPKDIQGAIQQIKDRLNPKAFILSIVAGILTKTLSKWLNTQIPIVRAMPNTPALLRAGATALYANTKTNDEQKNLAESIMRSVGVTVWLSHEHDMDTVTAISGSGPAYFFLMIQALQEAAEKMGLSSQTAKLLTLQTAMGAGRMALESEISIDALIARVASKGGTTERAIAVLENAGFERILQEAVKAAKDRSLEISEHFEASS